LHELEPAQDCLFLDAHNAVALGALVAHGLGLTHHRRRRWRKTDPLTHAAGAPGARSFT
jgi:hypothetical protein